jgi:hypothetical protein
MSRETPQLPSIQFHEYPFGGSPAVKCAQTDLGKRTVNGTHSPVAFITHKTDLLAADTSYNKDLETSAIIT